MPEMLAQFSGERVAAQLHPRIYGSRLPEQSIIFDKSFRILVVDDERAIREMISVFLEASGHIPFPASHGNKALAIMNTEKFDMVLCDVSMAPMDGFELLKNIRTIDADIPFIFISGEDDHTLPSRAFQEGADDFLRKPFSFDTLLEAMDRCKGKTTKMKHLPRNLA